MHAQIELSYKVSQPTIRRRRRRRMYVCCAVRCDTISSSISQEEWRERFVGWNGTQKRARTTRDFCCSAFILMQISHNNYENNGCACLSAFLVCHRRRVELFLEKEVFAKSKGWRGGQRKVCVSSLPSLLCFGWAFLVPFARACCCHRRRTENMHKLSFPEFGQRGGSSGVVGSAFLVNVWVVEGIF